MDDERSKPKGRGGRWAKGMGVVLGCAGIGALAWYVHWRQMTRIDGAHLLYLPVALACLWFGWRGLAVAILGGVCLIVPHFMGAVPETPLEHDILRTVVLIVVGATLALLRGRQAKLQRQVERLHWQLDKSRETSEAEYEILNCRLNRQLSDLRGLSETAERGNAEKEKILDSLGERVVYQDREMRVLWANRAACEAIGMAPEAVVGRRCHELWAQRAEPCTNCPVAEALRTGQPVQQETSTADGRWWLLQGYPIVDEAGEVVAGLEVGRDITESRRAQEQLQKVFDVSLDMVGILDVKRAMLVKVNPAFSRTLGYPVEAFLRQPLLEFVHPDDRDRTAALLREMANRRTKVTSFENRLCCQNGSYRWFSWNADTDLKTGLAYAAGRDVTEAKRAEETLAQERNLLRTLIDNLPDAVYVKDRESRFLLCNQTVLRHHGLERSEDLEGKSDVDLFPEEQAALFRAEEQEVVRTGQALIGRERCSKDPETGALIWHSTTKLPLKNAEGRTIGLIGIGRNVTECKRAQEAYEILVDHSSQGLIVFLDRRVAFANEAMARIIGYSVDEMLAASPQQLYEFIHPDDRDLVWTRHVARLEGAEVEPQYAFRIIRKGGTVAWLEIFASRVEYQGQPAIQATCMDITERVCAENALRESEAQNRGLLDAIPDFIFQLSADGVFLDYRLGEGQSLYLAPEEFLGQKAIDLLPPEVAERFAQALQQVVETGETQTFEYELPLEGMDLDWECRLVRFGREKVLAMVRDITERKSAERLRDLQRDVALALSGVSGLKDGYHRCLQTALDCSQMDCGVIYTVDRDTGDLHLVAHAGLSDEYVQSVQSVPRDSKAGRLALEGEPIFANYRTLGVPLSPTQRSEDLRAVAVVPVTRRGQVVACLNVGSRTMEEVPEWSRTVLDTIAAQIGSTVVRLQAEEALRREHSLVSRITDTSPAGIMLVNREGKIVFANACAERILGMTREQIIGRYYSASEWSISDYDGCPLSDEALPFTHVMATGAPVYDVRRAIVRPDGTRVLLRINAAPLLDETGRADGMVAAIDDVTEKVLAERSLRESEERFRGVFENAVLGLYRTARDGRVLMANPALVRMLGYESFEELSRLNVEDGYAAESRRADFIRCIESEGQVVGHEAAWKKRDGAPLFVRENARVIRDETGNVLYYEGTVEDVTERHRAEMRLRYRLDFEELVATISNDFISLSIDEIDGGIERTLERLGRFVDVDRSLMMLMGDGGDHFDAVYEWHGAGIESNRVRLLNGKIECLSWSIDRLTSEGSLNVPRVSDLQDQAHQTREILQASGVQSLLATPIMIGGEFFGTLSLDVVQDERTWSDDEIALLKIVAEVFANALGRRRSAEALSLRLAHETLLSDLSAVFVNLPVERIDEEIQQGMGRIATALGIDRAAMLRFCDEGAGIGVTHAWAADGLMHAPIGPLHGTFAWSRESIRRGQITAATCLDDVPGLSDEEKAYCRREGMKSAVLIPVAVAGETLGAMVFSSLRKERTWSSELIQRLRLMGEIFGNAMLRKRAEEALIASERNYREIFDATSEGTIIYDPTRRAILDVNEVALQMYGYSYAELLQSRPEALWIGIPPDGDEDAEHRLVNAVEQGSQIFECLSRRKDGGDFWTEVNLKKSSIGGQPRVIIVVRDITERKEAEKVAEMHRAELARAWHVNALGEMASGLAHELNQPLCAILNYANGCLRLTRKKELPKAALRDAVKEVIGQAERAGDIIKRIRGLVGKREPRCVKLDVKSLLSDAMGMIEKEAAKHDVTVVSELKGRLPKVKADDVEIEQVALNLMRNAIEAMGDEEGTERKLTIATSRPEKGTVEVAIRDTGRGLSPELSERVFDSFFTTKEHGLGIGLSLSRRIVEAHGGRLWAESDGSSGTTFRFTLPVVGGPHGKHRPRSVRRR